MNAELAVAWHISVNAEQAPDVLSAAIFRIPLLASIHFLHLASAKAFVLNP